MAWRLLLLSPLVLCVLAAGRPSRGAEDPRGVLRVAIPARVGPHSHLTPLVYWGGFQTKSAVYEPLVRFGAEGRLEPGLAQSWSVSDDGRVTTLRLRPGVTWHDGTSLSAEDVRDHLLRWRGNPGNRWLGSTDRMERVEATGPLEVRVTLSEPWCFLEECAIVNPGCVVGPGAYDHEGTFVKSVGTGPYRVEEANADEGYVFTANDAWWNGKPGLARIEVERLTAERSETPELIDRIRRDELDLVADGEGPILPREALAEAARDPRLRVWVGPGNGTTLLAFNTSRGPFADRELRRRVAAAVDRTAWVTDGELGYAAPATTLFRAGWAGWPRENRLAPASGAPPAGPVSATLLLVEGRASARLDRHLALLESQLRKAGVALKVERVASRSELTERMRSGAWDVSLRTTHGTPYDPFVMLQILFLAKPAGRTASSSPPIWEDAALVAAVQAGLGAKTAGERGRAFAAVQQRLDEEVPLVPLFVHKRVAVSSSEVDGLSIGENAFDLGLGRARAPARAPTPLARRLARPAQGAAAPPAPAAAPAAPPDPKDGDVPLPAEGGWNAALVLDNGTVGVWVVRSLDVFPMLGCPDVVGLDDKGRITILTSYSGRWTPNTLLNDGKWLGGLDQGDLDPRVPGPELYTGGEKGNLYEVVAHPNGVLDQRWIGETPGQAINNLLVGDVDPAHPGNEMLLFTWPGGLWEVTPSTTGFHLERIDRSAPRVRDVLLLPGSGGHAAEVIAVSRDGLLQSLRVNAGKPTWTTLHAEAMGMGRVAMKPRRSSEEAPVLYGTLDDGRILRLERGPGPGGAAEGKWSVETIYRGPQGPRGLAAGRFDADPLVETVAAFGYGRDVEILSRRPGGAWTRTTVFRDRDKGHWLSTAELDGRNGTDELLASGYGGRIVLLSRPPGYGTTGLVGAPR